MAGPAASIHEEALIRPISTFRPKLFLGSLVTGLLVVVLFYSWGYQIVNDIGVAGINRPVFWGFYIVNFVFWIGISHAGTLISAILRVTNAEWRRPVTRCAEAITFGDLDDPESRVSRMAEEQRATRLLEDLSTEPSVIYMRGGR